MLMAFSTLAVLFIFLSVAGYVAFGPSALWLETVVEEALCWKKEAGLILWCMKLLE